MKSRASYKFLYTLSLILFMCLPQVNAQSNESKIQKVGLVKPDITLQLDSVSEAGIHLSWTEYTRCNVTGYSIYRANMSTGKFTLLNSVRGNLLNFVDNDFVCPQPFIYYVKAKVSCAKVYPGASNQVVADPFISLSKQKMEIVESTALSDTTILTEWLKPSILSEIILCYDVYRSTDNKKFDFIARVEDTGSEFIDRNVDLRKHSYFYKIIPINSCDEIQVKGNYSAKVILSANETNGITKLKWSKHKIWETGVEKYVVEKLDDVGQWQVIKEVDGETFEVND